MYFGTLGGQRTGFVVFHVPDPSDMPPFAELFFMDCTPMSSSFR